MIRHAVSITTYVKTPVLQPADDPLQFERPHVSPREHERHAAPADIEVQFLRQLNCLLGLGRFATIRVRCRSDPSGHPAIVLEDSPHTGPPGAPGPAGGDSAGASCHDPDMPTTAGPDWGSYARFTGTFTGTYTVKQDTIIKHATYASETKGTTVTTYTAKLTLDRHPDEQTWMGRSEVSLHTVTDFVLTEDQVSFVTHTETTGDGPSTSPPSFVVFADGTYSLSLGDVTATTVTTMTGQEPTTSTGSAGFPEELVSLIGGESCRPSPAPSTTPSPARTPRAARRGR